MDYNKVQLRYLITICLIISVCSGCLREKNGGLILPDGFDAVVVVDSLPGRARHLAVNNNGDIYVKANRSISGGMNYVLRDSNKDGRADIIKNFGPIESEGAYATGMRIHNGYLYTSSEMIVYRYKLNPNEMVPSSEAEFIVIDSGLPREHDGKPLAFDGKGHIFVPFGAPSDACQEENRLPGSPGMRPCPILDSNGGVWMFDENKRNQFRTRDGIKVATGLRSLVAMTWNTQDSTLYCVGHGRDGLVNGWPQFYNEWQSALLPSEAFYKLKPGANAGWPYYYFDQMKGKVMVNPEYGGDGKIENADKSIETPIVGFPGHYAPNDLLFYTGNQFPDRYKNGAFIAFHGSTIRAPYPQAGYIVAFVPFVNGKPQKWEVFADGFTGKDTLVNTSDSKSRPMGLAQGPDGSLYISDSKKGKIWKIQFKGDKKSFSEKNLAIMKARENRTNVKNPDIIVDNLERNKVVLGGEKLYQLHCRACHQQNGQGDGIRFPSIAGSDWVNGKKDTLIAVLLKGLEGPIKINKQPFNGVMPKFSQLPDRDIANILTYVRRNFGNQSDTISKVDVTIVRHRFYLMKKKEMQLQKELNNKSK
jgi:glucose/arabinose dehydrogenase/mono/diheme cytochrome c family protein